jgi:ABC-type branched-subunit amino acid transport system ATPase component
MHIETSDDFAIHTNNLTKRYGKTLATNGLNLSVRRGTTFGLLGPNGAGKVIAFGVRPLHSDKNRDLEENLRRMLSH